jgi:phage terminase large subunit
VSGTVYQIEQYPSGSGQGYEPRGACLDLMGCRGPEVVLAGPSGTGKTFACCHKLNALCWKYPGVQAVMLRKEYKTLIPTAYQTFRKVHADLGPKPRGGEKPEWLDYPNGSRLWLAGLDNPGKALSSDRDFVYVNQAEELSLEDWGVLCSRATGRAGNSPYPQVMGDANPGPPWHWIKGRAREGRLTLLESRHEDNPTLFDKGEWTALGKQTLATLDALPGVLKDRLRHGRWVAAEGTVFAFDARLHVVDRMPASITRRIRSVDFGFVNPFACLWVAVDGDGRMYLYRELYHTGRTVAEHAQQINALSAGESIEATVADHDAEDRATLLLAGIGTVPAVKDVSPGIQAVEARLRVAGDGRPRLFVVRGCLVERDESLVALRKPCCTEEEFQSYSWPKGSDGKPVKEAPLKVNDHGMDALRYVCMYVDGSPAFTRASIGTSRVGPVAGMPVGVFGTRRPDAFGSRKK